LKGRHGGIIEPGIGKLGRPDQVRTLDKVRRVKRLGAVHAATRQKLLTALRSVFAPGCGGASPC
jgi:mRNA-degrading endonuclease toxin of MazEF toxin-antitoxin module